MLEVYSLADWPHLGHVESRRREELVPEDEGGLVVVELDDAAEVVAAVVHLRDDVLLLRVGAPRVDAHRHRLVVLVRVHGRQCARGGRLYRRDHCNAR